VKAVSDKVVEHSLA